MIKKKQTECKTTKHFPRDFRGRFAKRSEKPGTINVTIPTGSPALLYVQSYYPETDFEDVWDNNVIDRFRTTKALSIDPHMKTYKVWVSGQFKLNEFDDTAPFPGFNVNFESYENAPLPYKEVIKLRQNSGNPIRLSDYTESNEGIGNIGTGNIGLQNIGFYNKGIRVAGCFNAGNSGIFMFNKPCLEYKSYLEVDLPPFLSCPLDNLDDFDKPLRYMTALESFNKAKLKEDWPTQYKMLISLPNFDYSIFAHITGISKKMLDEANKEWKNKFGKKHRRKK